MNKLLSPENIKNIVYGLVVILLIVAAGSISLLSDINPTLVYLLIQILILVTGILHAMQIYGFLPHLQAEKLSPGLVYTIVLTVLGAILLVVLYVILNHISMIGFAATLVLFPFPFLVRKAYAAFIGIPSEKYKLWYYPSTDPNPPTDISRFLDISFEFPKKSGELQTNFKVKAPIGMSFGELFHLFLAEYNERHPDSTVQYLNETGKPYGWLFHLKTPKNSKKVYLDPEESFGRNGIQDRDTVYAERF